MSLPHELPDVPTPSEPEGTLWARRAGWPGLRYLLLDAEDEVVGSVRFHGWREAAEIAIGERRYRVRRMREPGRPWVLECDGWRLAEARKPSAWRDRFEIRLGRMLLELQPVGWGSPCFELRRDGLLLGEVERLGWSGQGAALRFTEGVPPVLHAFVFVLARLIWNRHAAAAGG